MEVRRVDRSELLAADEAFLCGTGVQIAPITSVDGRVVGNGQMGPITQALQQFVTDRTGVAALGLTRDDLGRALAERGYPRLQVVALVHILEKCENARFSPATALPDEMEKLIDQATRTLDALETVKPSGAA